MVSAVEAPARGLFTSALVPPLSINLPPVSLHRVRTRLFLLCFVSEMQTPMSTARGSVPGPVEKLRFCLYACVFFAVFSQVVGGRGHTHSSRELKRKLL